jgi:hypothetical protein
MVVAGPQRGLFFACLLVGSGSLLALDLHYAPAALAPPLVVDAGEPSAPVNGGGTTNDAAVAARVVIPAPARVPTIVARFDSASKDPEGQSGIRALATAMIEDHDVTIVLEGHSDTRGGDDFNHTISLERANYVKARLVELGVSAERIETVGLGATRPLRSDDPAAPSVNRRVEVRWLGSAARDAPVAKAAPRPKETRETPRDAQAAEKKTPRDGSAPTNESTTTPSDAPPADTNSDRDGDN